MHFLQAINSGISVLIDCNKTGGTIKGDIKKIFSFSFSTRYLKVRGIEFVMQRYQLVASVIGSKMVGIDVNVRKFVDIFTSSQ